MPSGNAVAAVRAKKAVVIDLYHTLTAVRKLLPAWVTDRLNQADCVIETLEELLD